VAISYDDLIEFFRTGLALDVEDIEPDTLLFSTGIINSLALVNLMTFIETEGKFRISPTHINLGNFDSVERILAYVARQTSASVSA